MATATSFFCKADFKKEIMPIFYDNQNQKFVWWFFFLHIFCFCLQINIAPNWRKIMGNRHTDGRCWILHTGRMIRINSKTLRWGFEILGQGHAKILTPSKNCWKRTLRDDWIPEIIENMLLRNGKLYFPQDQSLI